MPDEKQTAGTEGEKPEALSRDDVAAIVNGTVNKAITDHLKRAMGGVEKTIADTVAKALAAAPKPENATDAAGAEGKAGAVGAKGAVDPEVKLLREQLDQLKKKSDEAEQRARATEEKARRDKARAALREALEEEGIKPAHARALIADFEANNAIRFDDDGTASVAVRRVRQKDAEPEEVEFADFKRAVKDWAKGDDAKDWLPAPGSKNPNAPKPGANPTGPRRVRTDVAPEKPPATFEESVSALKRHLDSQGLDGADLLND